MDVCLARILFFPPHFCFSARSGELAAAIPATTGTLGCPQRVLHASPAMSCTHAMMGGRPVTVTVTVTVMRLLMKQDDYCDNKAVKMRR